MEPPTNKSRLVPRLRNPGDEPRPALADDYSEQANQDPGQREHEEPDGVVARRFQMTVRYRWSRILDAIEVDVSVLAHAQGPSVGSDSPLGSIAATRDCIVITQVVPEVT